MNDLAPDELLYEEESR